MSVLRKIAAHLKADGGFSAPTDEGFQKKYPGLWEFLTTTEYPDDAGKRENGTMLVFCEDSNWKCCLNDRSSESSAWATGASFDQLLKAIEKGLQDGSLDWRVKKPYPAKKK